MKSYHCDFCGRVVDEAASGKRVALLGCTLRDGVTVDINVDADMEIEVCQRCSGTVLDAVKSTLANLMKTTPGVPDA